MDRNAHDGADAPGRVAPQAAGLRLYRDETAGVMAEGFVERWTTDSRALEAAGSSSQSATPTDANTQSLRRSTKRVIVLAACWGFPAAWAHWLIEQGGLKHG